MKRMELEKFIIENYSSEPDYPWQKYPTYAVFRHSNNKKWFALLMNVEKSKLGLEEEGSLDVVNLKCDPLLIDELRHETGFFPAYHMNKDYWVSVALDGSVADDKIKMLLDMSYCNTAVTMKKK